MALLASGAVAWSWVSLRSTVDPAKLLAPAPKRVVGFNGASKDGSFFAQAGKLSINSMLESGIPPAFYDSSAQRPSVTCEVDSSISSGEPAAVRGFIVGESETARAAEPSPNLEVSVSCCADRNADAASLFRAANAQRRGRNFDKAAALYRRLESEFSKSDEAQIAHVALGKLLLQSGQVVQAETQFAGYLAGESVALRAEALFGQANCLAQLRNYGEERRVLETILRDFKGSVYAPYARHRLIQLVEADH